jgi:hypothetical protein
MRLRLQTQLTAALPIHILCTPLTLTWQRMLLRLTHTRATPQTLI